MLPKPTLFLFLFFTFLCSLQPITMLLTNYRSLIVNPSNLLNFKKIYAAAINPSEADDHDSTTTHDDHSPTKDLDQVKTATETSLG